MEKSRAHDEMICRITACLSPFSKGLHIEKKGCGLIQVFSNYKGAGKSPPYKIAHADIVLLDESSEPILVIEPETSSSPKTFGRSILIYAIADEVRIAKTRYQIKKPLLLMIVVPNNKHDIHMLQKRLEDIRDNVKKIIEIEGSSLKDICFCQIGDFEHAVKELFQNNNYSSLAEKIGRKAG